VSPKSLALIAAAVAVMIMGVYLFIQVKASPAQAQSSATQTVTPRAERTIETPAPPIEHAQPAAPAPAPAPPPIRVGNSAVEAQVAAAPAEEQQRANPKLDSLMELANKAYDSQDFDQAIAIAGKVLAKDPMNVRMLRIMVSANCISGDSAVAQSHYDRLPKPPAVDREQMKARCDRYQVTLRD
jgi:hypothetical protein